MSEFQSSDELRTRILIRLRGRLVFTAAGFLVGLLFLLLSACDSTTQTTRATAQTSESADDTVAVQTVGDQTLAPEENQLEESQLQETQPEETQLSEDNHADEGQTIRFTDSNEDIWPPQPEDITEVITITPSRNSAKTDNIRRAMAANPLLADSVGARHEILAQQIVHDKNDKASQIKAEIYDYENNQVVTIELDTNGTDFTRSSINDAQDYQPPESPAEVARAIELASLSLSKQGFTEHTNLTGTGLLAYPTTAESVASGANFYRQRKIYVTFGTGNGKLPLYRALVNLSTNSVESSGSIQ